MVVTMEQCDPETALREAHRRFKLLGPLSRASYDYQRLRERAAATYVPLKVLWTWWRAYQKDGLDGLVPRDWIALDAQTEATIAERLAQLGDLVRLMDEAEAEASIITPELVAALAERNGWSLRTAERWIRRYQVGGRLGLARQHDPEKAGPKRKTSPVTALGAMNEQALEETFRRRELLGDLATKPKVSRAEVEARAKEVGIAQSTLWLYLKQYRDAGLGGLTPRERADKGGHHRISEHMHEIIRGVRFSQVNKSVRSVYQAVCQKAQALGEPAPSEWQVRKICAQMHEPEVLLADGRDDDFRDRYEVTMRMEHIRRASFLITYQIDHTPVDVLVKDLRSKPYQTKSGEVRPWLTTCIDSRSRLLMAAVFGYDHPDRYTVATAIREAVLTSEQKLYGGKPHEIWVDNGHELLAHHVLQLTQALQIVLHPCKPHRPQEKGIVERFFGTLNTRLWADQPGYVASNTEERNPHAQAKLTLAELEERFWTFIHRYHQEVHSETGETPLEYWEKHCYAEPADPRELDVLLKEPIDRVVAKDGIYYRNRIYWHAMVPDLVGKHVEIRAEPIYRAPDEVEVFLDHQWMCTAKATDAQVITQKDMGTAKREQKEHLRRSIKKAREAAEAADREIAALQGDQPTQPAPSPEAPAQQTPSPSKPKRQGRASPEPPARSIRGDFLERMAAREEEQRKREDA
jgi:putative transposase